MRSLGVRARTDGRVFPILLALYVPILYPILRADRYYNDDLKRSLLGLTATGPRAAPYERR